MTEAQSTKSAFRILAMNHMVRSFVADPTSSPRCPFCFMLQMVEMHRDGSMTFHQHSHAQHCVCYEEPRRAEEEGGT